MRGFQDDYVWIRKDRNMLRVHLLADSRACQLLQVQAFQAEWRTLTSVCAYATYFQSPEFVLPWYEIYRASYEPVILHGIDRAGATVGLWFLALEEASQQVVHAGAHQAEYQTWLATPESERKFVEYSMMEVQRALPSSKVVLKYAPSAEPVRLLEEIPTVARRIRVTPRSRPLLRVERQAVTESFAKKSNRSRFNRLKRLGKVEFKRIIDAAELAHMLPAVMAFYDFRQAAINGCTPFRSDALKCKFHAALFSTSAIKQHVTITYLDGRPIAALWASITGKTVHLGILAYLPTLAEHSPGKLHIMQLAQMLLEEDLEVLDLTPGGDPWKERFANDHDEVAEVLIFPTPLSKWFAGLLDGLLHKAKHVAAIAGVSPEDGRRFFGSLRKATPSVVLQKCVAWLGKRTEHRVYRIERASAEHCQCDPRVAENAIDDLLCFEPDRPQQTRRRFMSEALVRLESGQSVFTVMAEKRLACYGWMARSQKQISLGEARHVLTIPNNSVVFHDLHVRPSGRAEELVGAMIGHMLRLALTEPSTSYVYVSMLADDAAIRRAVESFAFEYRGSFHWQCRFGFKSGWHHPVSSTNAGAAYGA